MTITDSRVRLSAPARVTETCTADVTAAEVAGLGASLGVARASLRAAVDGLHATVSGDGFGWALDAEVAETLVDLPRPGSARHQRGCGRGRMSLSLV
jgi:hypothetical protein